MSDSLTALTTGFLASLSLIVAIGAQNAWVLRQGPESESLVKAINEALLKMTDDGRVKAIQEKWLGAYTALPREVPVK